VAEIERTNQVLREAALRHPDNARLLPLSDLKNETAVQAMLDWLGFPGCRVIALPHSNNGGEMTKMNAEMRCDKTNGCVSTEPTANRFIDISNC